MFSFIRSVLDRIRTFFAPQAPMALAINPAHRAFLAETVAFYSVLDAAEKVQFEQRCLSFLEMSLGMTLTSQTKTDCSSLRAR